jgi:type II secretory pathway pseudopilin PulG
MIVVLFVLVIFASLIAPNLVSQRDGQRRRAAYGQVLDLISEARLSAVGNDSTYAITWDSGASQFDLKKEPPNQDSDNSSSIPSPESRPLQTATNIGEFEQVKALTIPSPLQPEAFRIGDNNSDPGSWAIHFYPDGTSDGGGFQIAAGNDVKSVLIDRYGLATQTNAPLPDPTDVVWPAGTYDQKI